jgi:hypothetical protein
MDGDEGGLIAVFRALLFGKLFQPRPTLSGGEWEREARLIC